jgi:uncharacterized MnhB-related membrane protein
MEKFNLVMIILLSLAIIISAIMAVTAKKISDSIISAGVISLFASIFFLVLASPDVAMTEAAIGAGLTTFLFFIILRKTEQQNDKK